MPDLGETLITIVSNKIVSRPLQFNLADYPADLPFAYQKILSSRGIAAHEVDKSLRRLCPLSSLSHVVTAAAVLATVSRCCIYLPKTLDSLFAALMLVRVLRLLQIDYQLVFFEEITDCHFEQAANKNQENAELAIVLEPEANTKLSKALLASLSHRVQINTQTTVDRHCLVLSQRLPAPMDFAGIWLSAQGDTHFLSDELSISGLMFYLLGAYAASHTNQLTETFDIKTLLPLVALGTLAAPVLLDNNNRILVEQGLLRLRNRQLPLGLLSLADLAQLSLPTLSALEVQNQLLPYCSEALNSGQNALLWDCLLTDNAHLAFDYAEQLVKNYQQKLSVFNELTVAARRYLNSAYSARHFIKSAQAELLQLNTCPWSPLFTQAFAHLLWQQTQKPLVLWQNQQVKIIAPRTQLLHLARTLFVQLPALSFSFSPADSLLTIREVVHPAAFLQCVHAFFQKQASLAQTIYTDGQLPILAFDLAKADNLRLLEPWSAGLPEPQFDDLVYIEKIDTLNGRDARIYLRLENVGEYFHALAFDKYREYATFSGGYCRMVYRLAIREWRGRRILNLVIQHLFPQ